MSNNGTLLGLNDLSSIFIADAAAPTSLGGILSIDPLTGVQTTITSAGNFVSPFGIAIDANGDLLVTDPNAFGTPGVGGPGGIVKVDPETGAQTVISSSGIFSGPIGIVIDANGDIIVADSTQNDNFNGGLGGVIKVNPLTGDQTLISSEGSFFAPVGIAIDNNEDFIVADFEAFGGSGGIIRVNPVTGTQTTISSGGSFVDPYGIAIDTNGDFIVADANAFGGSGGIIRVNPVTGTQTTISSGDNFIDPLGIAIDTNGDLIVTDVGGQLGTGSVIHVDPTTGTQTTISTGGTLVDPIGVAIIANDPTVSISPATISQPEGDSGTTAYTYTVSLSNPSDQVVTVNYSTNDETATVADGDYTDNDGTLTFNPGEPLSQEITILANGDIQFEADEKFIVKLDSATNATIVEKSIDTISGDIKQISPPPSVTNDSFESDNEAFIFPERSNVLLTDDLSVDLASPGTISGGSTIPGIVANGTAVDSFYIHFDPIGEPSSGRPASGSVTFGSEVLGLVISQSRLNQSDTILGVQDTAYPGSQSLSSADSVTLSEDRRTVLFDLTATTGTDPIRVITAAANSEAQGIIENEDPLVSISPTTISQPEGNSGTTAYTYLVSLSKPSDQIVTVDYSTNDGTATVADGDYEDNDGSLIFNPDDPLNQEITIFINGDTQLEDDEEFTVKLNDATNAGIVEQSIINFSEGITLISPQSSILDDVRNDILESDDEAFLFSERSSVLLTDDLSVDHTSPGTISGGSKVPGIVSAGTVVDSFYIHFDPSGNPSSFIPASGSITFGSEILGLVTSQSRLNQSDNILGLEGTSYPSNQSLESGDIITLSDDRRTLLFDFTARGGTDPLRVITTASNSEAKGVIENDDNLPQTTISISPATLSLDEGNDGITAYLFEVNLSNPSTQTVTVPYTIDDGTATVADGDYLDNDGTLTFNPGDPLSQTITVLVNGDTTREENEDFFVRLGTPTEAVLSSTANESRGVILNDDFTAGILEFSPVNFSALENNETAQITVIRTGGDDGEVSATLTLSDGTATAPDDYNNTPIVVNFADGQNAQVVSIPIVNDGLFESDETVNLQLENPIGGATLGTQDTALLTILGDEPQPRFTIDDVSVEEGDEGTTTALFTVTLSGEISDPATVDYATASGPGGRAKSDEDFIATNGTLTFNPGVTTQTIPVEVIGDINFERDEIFFVNLSNASSGVTIADGQGTGLIVSDVDGLVISDASLLEGDSGTTIAQFEVTPSDPISTPIELFFTTENIGTNPGLARGNFDYIPTSGFLTVTPDAPGIIEVEVIGDTFAELDEIFRVRLADASSPIGIFDKEGIGTILNDDRGLGINNVSIFEGDSGLRTMRFTVTLAETITEPLLVDYATANGSARAGSDYEATSGTLTFNPGETRQFIDVSVIGDTIQEFNEFFTVRLTNPSNPDLLLADALGFGSILDDDFDFIPPPPGYIGLDISDAFVFERDNDQKSIARFTVTRYEDINQVLTVNYATSDGTAIAGDDYEATSGTLTFNPGQRSKTINVVVNGDNFIEPTEVFFMNLFQLSSGRFFDSQGMGFIYDDPEGLAINNVTVLEGNSASDESIAQFTVSLRDPITEPLTVDFATEDTTEDNRAIAGEDYIATSGSLTFLPGETTQIVNVELIEDTEVEPNETFFVNLSNASQGAIADSRGLGTIRNDDPILVDTELSLLVDISASVDSNEYQLQFEGYAQAFDNPSLFTEFIAPREQGKAAVNLVVWSSENQQKEAIGWTLIDSVEASQQFASQIRSLLANRPFQGETAPGSAIDFADDLIFDNFFDSTNQIIDVSGDGVENDGIDTETARDAALSLGIEAINGITIGSETIKNFYQTEVVGGTNIKGDPAFTLQADTFEDFQIAIQKKLPRELGELSLISIDDVTVSEGSGTTQAIFTLSLDRADLVNPISVDFTTVDGIENAEEDSIARAGEDYVAISGNLTFAPGETTQTITVDILEDTETEPDEFFRVFLSNATNGFIFDSEGVGTILDNSPPIATEDSYSVNEDNTLIVNSANGILNNDSDINGDSLRATLLSNVSNGILTLSDDGSFTYTPNLNFNGMDSFTYTVDDGKGGIDTATVNLTVNPVNDPPVAVDDNYSVDEDTTLTINPPGLLVNDSDVDGDSLTVTVTEDVDNGTLTLNSDGSFDYTPNTNFNGADSFTYTLSDGNGGTDTAIVNLTINPVNDAPVAADDNYSTDEDTALTLTAAELLANDSDVDGDSLTITSNTDPANGSVTVNADGSFTYNPNPDFNGTDSFTYTISDGTETATATVNLTINPINDAPVAVDDNYSVDEDDTLLTGNVLTNDSDPDGDDLIVSAVNGNAADVGTQITLDSGAKLTLNADGTFSYDPDDLDDDDGTNDLFTYTVSDGNGGSDTATVTVTVTDDDDGDDLFSGGEDELLSGLGNNNYAEILSFDSLDESVLYGSSSEYNLEKTNSGNGIFNDRDLISLVQDDIITDLEKDSSLSLF